MIVLVTGNQGYVGTVLTPFLAAAGHEVWGLDTGYYEPCLLGPLGTTGLARQIVKDVRDVSADELAARVIRWIKTAPLRRPKARRRP